MGPNWKTGPHSQKCLNSLWDKAGYTGNLNERIHGSGLSLSSELNKWNSNGYVNAAASMNQYHKNMDSTEYNTAKMYTKACLGNYINPCQAKFTSRPKDCDIAIWNKSGCSKKGLLNPETNKKWNLNFSNRFQETPPENNSQGALNKLYNDIMGYKTKADYWKRNADKNYTNAINYNQSCYGESPPRPFKKLCWRDFSDKMSVISGITIHSKSIDFSNGPNIFKPLLSTNVDLNSNNTIKWNGNYILKEMYINHHFFQINIYR